jgi:DNA-binding MarR family transcriptional regulator
MARTIRQEDHVDRFLGELRDKLPAIDLRVEGIVERIFGIQWRLRRMLDETLEQHGLSWGEYRVLGSLRMAPEQRRSAGELATKIELSSAAMTNRLDRLENAGLVRRIPDREDRRSVQVELTKKGRARYDCAVGAQAAKESIVVAALDVKQQEQLNDLLRMLMLEVEQRTPKKR